MLTSPEIEECENEDPDEVDEVPVEARDFDDLVISSSAREEPTRASVEIAAPNFAGDDEQKDHADRHVGTVEPGDHEEAGAELRGAPGVPPRPHSLEDQLRPLE